MENDRLLYYKCDEVSQLNKIRHLYLRDDSLSCGHYFTVHVGGAFPGVILKEGHHSVDSHVVWDTGNRVDIGRERYPCCSGQKQLSILHLTTNFGGSESE